MLAFYADESGSFAPSNTQEPWAVLLAVGIDDSDWWEIDDAMNDLKRRFFPNAQPVNVEVRSNDLRMAHVRPSPSNPFSTLSPAALRSFGECLYLLIEALPFHWCACAIHKPTATRLCGARTATDLFAFIYPNFLAMLDRWCEDVGKSGRLFIDQQGSGLHGRVHDRIVAMHDRFREAGNARGGERIIERPYFHDSARSNHVQLADIIAYNVFRRFREDDPYYPYFVRVHSKLWRATGASIGSEGLLVCRPGPEK